MPKTFSMYSRTVRFIKKKTVTIETLIEALINEKAHYDDVFINGGQDPFWPDGVNLNLVRNHIIYDKKQIEDFCQDNNIPLPKEYYEIVTPEKIDDSYMARKEEILKTANEADNVLFPYYQKLINLGKKISEKQKNSISFHNVAGYYITLKNAIANLNYVEMRRYCYMKNGVLCGSYIESFEQLYKKIDNMEPEQFQLSFF